MSKTTVQFRPNVLQLQVRPNPGCGPTVTASGSTRLPAENKKKSERKEAALHAAGFRPTVDVRAQRGCGACVAVGLFGAGSCTASQRTGDWQVARYGGPAGCKRARRSG